MSAEDGDWSGGAACCCCCSCCSLYNSQSSSRVDIPSRHIGSCLGPIRAATLTMSVGNTGTQRGGVPSQVRKRCFLSCHDRPESLLLMCSFDSFDSSIPFTSFASFASFAPPFASLISSVTAACSALPEQGSPRTHGHGGNSSRRCFPPVAQRNTSGGGTSCCDNSELEAVQRTCVVWGLFRLACEALRGPLGLSRC